MFDRGLQEKIYTTLNNRIDRNERKSVKPNNRGEKIRNFQKERKRTTYREIDKRLTPISFNKELQKLLL